MEKMFYYKDVNSFIKYKSFAERIFSIKHMKNITNNIYADIITLFGIKFVHYNFRIYKNLKENYKNIIKRIQRRVKSRGKIKVLFLVNEISKWKTQSLWNLMKESDLYEPVIAITIADIYTRFSSDEKIKILKETYDYYTARGMNCVYAFSAEKNTTVPLHIFKPDIVFYQQPWGLSVNQGPLSVAQYALTCYVPYYVPNYGILKMDCKKFHSYLYRFYTLNKTWENYYKEYMEPINYNIYGLGHTMLDEINRQEVSENEGYVIYAPHWSIAHRKNRNMENYSTFLYTGVYMLNFAKQHPEIKWAFKPHPTLKVILRSIGWPEKMVENYYSEWEKIAKCCYDASYIDLFNESRALITDCASFLIEYFCTGKPIIHLIPLNSRIRPARPSADIFNTFYQVRKQRDLKKYLDDVILKGNDRNLNERLELLQKSGLKDSNAAKNIIDDLTKSIVGKL